MNRGTLFGVSVGPGEPELLTLKAARILAGCGVIAAPVTADGRMLAYEIACGAVDLSGKTLLPLRLPMSRDGALLTASRRRAAEQLEARLEQGRDVALLNLGDASVYSSFSYLARLLRADGYPVEVVPGVPSFCAAAAALGTELTQGDLPLHILPAGAAQIGPSLRLPGTKVFMKAGEALPELLGALRGAGDGLEVQLVSDCGLPGQRLCRSLDEAGEASGYFTVILVREKGKQT